MSDTEDQCFANYFMPYRAPAMKYAHMNATFRVSKQNKSMYTSLTQMATFLKRILITHEHGNFPLSLPLILQASGAYLILQK